MNIKELGEFNCRQCSSKQKKIRGCLTNAPFPVFSLDKEDYFRCPLKYIDNEASFYLKLYFNFKEGYLPLAGGILDQPNIFLEAIEILSRELADAVR